MSYRRDLFYCIVYGICVPMMTMLLKFILQLIRLSTIYHIKICESDKTRYLDKLTLTQISSSKITAGKCYEYVNILESDPDPDSKMAWRPADGWHLIKIDHIRVLSHRNSDGSYMIYSLQSLKFLEDRN